MSSDVDTAQRLELVRGARGSACNTPYSLLGTLSHCHTTGGSRLLRASILQPPCLAADIEQRLDCVQELVNSPALFHALQVL
jgi:DNA mismatch repair protein MSH4